MRIVIIGAGFVSLAAIRKLTGRVPAEMEISVINPTNQFLFAPRLIDALGDEAPQPPLVASLDELAQTLHFNFISGRVVSLDRFQQTVTYETLSGKAVSLPFDFAIVGSGARAAYYDIPGVAEHALPLKSLDDIARIHAQVDETIRTAAHLKDKAERQRRLQFTVIGAGPSGVEAIFALKQYVERHIQRLAPDLLPLVTYSLIQGAPQILPGFPLPIIQSTMHALQDAGVRVFLNELVSDLSSDQLATKQGTRLPHGLVIWCAGIEPCVIPMLPHAAQDRSGNIYVDHFLRVDQHVFAAGDVASYQEKNFIIPKNAQTAMLMGAHIATNILRLQSGRSLIPFHFFSRGNLLVIGRTGFLDLDYFSLQSRIVPFLRNLFYRFRFWQLTGKK